MGLDKEAVRAAAAGRWVEILAAAGIPIELLDGKHHPCPKCGGADRFRLVDADAGAVLCNQCFNHKSGDGFAAVAWIRGINFSESVDWVGEYLEMEPPRHVSKYQSNSSHNNGDTNSTNAKQDIIALVAAAKGMPLAAFRRFRPRPAKRNGVAVARVDAYGPDKEPCSHFDVSVAGDADLRKGKFKWRGKQGVFVPDRRFPRPGEKVLCGEGFKDIAAILGLGWGNPAVGLPGKQLPKEFAEWFAGCHVTIVAHRDEPGEAGAEKTASRLAGIAASVKIAHLPGEIKKSGGIDARDVIKLHGTEALIQAIRDAKEWSGPTDQPILEVTNGELVPNGEGEQVEPLAMNEILTRIFDRTRTEPESDGWPRRVGDSLFVHERPHGVHWLRSCDHFFGWLGSAVGTVNWYKAAGCHSKTEVYSRLQQVAPSHDAVSALPHFPPLAGWYYACDPPQPGSGSALRELIGFFNPLTLADVDLILALIVTPFWGGPAGSRPAFFVTGKNRGDGKTTLVSMAGRLAGGLYDFNKGENYERIKTRLLTRLANEKRLALIDNIKANRFSWAELEALITAKEISGHELYKGEASRPNILTWAFTANGPSVSKDISQRVIVIKLAKPIRQSDGQDEDEAFLSWETRINDFMEEHREALIADIAAFYARPVKRMARWTRWELWSKAVLARLPEPSETLAVIEERQRDIDADEDEGGDVEDFFRKEIEKAGYDSETETVHIPSYLACQWYSAVVASRVSSVAMTRAIRQAEEEGVSKRIIINPSRTNGRGILWVAKDELGEVRYDLIDKLEQQRNLYGHSDWKL